jgi:hypothetical protein
MLRDKRMRSLQQLIVELMPSIQMVQPSAFFLVTCISVFISVSYGNSGPGAAYMLTLHAFNLCNPDIPPINKEVGIQFGKFAISVLERYTEISSAAKTYVVYACMRSLVDHLQGQLEYFEMALKYGIASHTGDYVGFAIGGLPCGDSSLDILSAKFSCNSSNTGTKHVTTPAINRATIKESIIQFTSFPHTNSS